MRDKKKIRDCKFQASELSSATHSEGEPLVRGERFFTWAMRPQPPAQGRIAPVGANKQKNSKVCHIFGVPIKISKKNGRHIIQCTVKHFLSSTIWRKCAHRVICCDLGPAQGGRIIRSWKPCPLEEERQSTSMSI